MTDVHLIVMMTGVHLIVMMTDVHLIVMMTDVHLAALMTRGAWRRSGPNGWSGWRKRWMMRGGAPQVGGGQRSVGAKVALILIVCLFIKAWLIPVPHSSSSLPTSSAPTARCQEGGSKGGCPLNAP